MANTSQQNSSASASNTGSSAGSTAHQQEQSTAQQSRQPGQTAAPASKSDRQRPIQSGRDSERQTQPGTGVAQQRRGSPVYGGGSNPFVAMRRMAEDMDRMFEQLTGMRTGLGLTSGFGSTLGQDPWTTGTGQSSLERWSPQVETFRRGNNLVIRADVPGVKKEDIDVHVEDGLLTISGERREEREDDQEGFYRSERSYGQFYRAIPLPDGVSGEQCDASFKDGVLEVTLPAPKQEEKKPRRIQIR